MKFLLISYSEVDGVGQHVISLNSSLKKLGHQSKVVLLHKFKSQDKDVIKINRSFILRFIFFILEFLKKDFSSLFSFGNSTINYNSIKKYIDESEIIIIYSAHKILSFSMIEKIFDTNKTVYLRPLDMEFASGGCHVNFLKNGNECRKFESNCNSCPQLNFLNFFNYSKIIFNKKKKILEKYKPKIFVENTFTKKIYNASPITQKIKTETIFLGVNKKRTNFLEKNNARKILEINQDDKVLLFGTFNMDAPHKGGRLIEDILKIFITNLKLKGIQAESQKLKLITFGRKNTFSFSIPEIEWTHLNEIHSDTKLNLLYRAADVFISPSTGCNGPHIILEALANDLPVVAFDQGVAQDSVIDAVNGYLAPCFDKQIFSNGVFKTLFSKELVIDNPQNKKLKLLFDSTNEAKILIQNALSDLKSKEKN